jgi:hypothetical protein
VSAAFFLFLLGGGILGWVFHRGRVAFLDWRVARARHKAASAVFRHEILWSAGAAVAALLVIRALI